MSVLEDGQGGVAKESDVEIVRDGHEPDCVPEEAGEEVRMLDQHWNRTDKHGFK